MIDEFVVQELQQDSFMKVNDMLNKEQSLVYVNENLIDCTGRLRSDFKSFD